MNATATITISGARAVLTGGDVQALVDCCEAVDAGRAKQAAIAGFGSGKVRLHKGRKFPAGFAESVRKWHADRDYAITVVEDDLTRAERKQRIAAVDAADGRHISDTLRDEQRECVQALAKHVRGARASVPTAGGKTHILAALAGYYWYEFGWRTTIVTSRKGIAAKNANECARLLEGVQVGQFGDGKKNVGIVTSASAQSLLAWRERATKKKVGRNTVVVTRAEDPKVVALMEQTDVLMFDEAHHGHATSWYEIGMKWPAKVRIGVTGTMDTGNDVNNLRLEAVCGPLAYEISARAMIDMDRIREPIIAVVLAPQIAAPVKVHTPPKELYHSDPKEHRRLMSIAYREAYDQSFTDSDKLVRAALLTVRWFLANGRRPAVIVNRKRHFTRLQKTFEAADYAVSAIWGDTPTFARDDAKRRFANSDSDLMLVSTGTFAEGEDVPSIDALAIADGGQAVITTLQKIGRAMRMTVDGPKDAWIADLRPTGHKWFAKHARAAIKAYRSKGHKVFQVFGWPNEWPVSNLPKDLLPFLPESTDDIIDLDDEEIIDLTLDDVVTV